jgi:hypothetical protein
MEPLNDDQHDPLGLNSNEKNANRTLTKAQIQSVANQSGVSYEEAKEKARQQGYKAPAD